MRLFIGRVAIAGITASLLGCGSADDPPDPRKIFISNCTSEISAYGHSKQFVRKEIRPRSTDFPSASQVDINHSGGCEYVIKGYVDTENSFGVPVRVHYTIVMEYRGVQWYGSQPFFADFNTVNMITRERLTSKQESRDRERLRFIQQKLTRKGYDLGEVDGLMGPATEAAIRAFQEDEGLIVNGIASERLWRHLAAPSSL